MIRGGFALQYWQFLSFVTFLLVDDVVRSLSGASGRRHDGFWVGSWNDADVKLDGIMRRTKRTKVVLTRLTLQIIIACHSLLSVDQMKLDIYCQLVNGVEHVLSHCQ